MNTTHKTRSAAKASTLRLLRRTASAAAVVAVVAAAIAVPITAPEPTPGSAPMVIAIARADCPPDCGPGGGGTPSGPPGGGTEFVPPSMPAMPSYEPGRGQPPLDQNNGISIYNSATPQPSQAAQPSQAPVQNQDGTYNRAANGEQQPINYNNPPDNQQTGSNWQKLSDELNQDSNAQTDQTQDKEVKDRCAMAEQAYTTAYDSLTAQLATLSDQDPRRGELADQIAQLIPQTLADNGVTLEQCSTAAAGDVLDISMSCPAEYGEYINSVTVERRGENGLFSFEVAPTGKARDMAGPFTSHDDAMKVMKELSCIILRSWNETAIREFQATDKTAASVFGQLACHMAFAKNKPTWNLEPARPIGDQIVNMCNVPPN